jgi:AcrR family transcriptional regulator
VKTERRTYRQSARAAATQETRERILQATRDALLTRWFDEVTLNEIAAAAGVSVQTLVNHFGGKEGLLGGLVERFSADIEEVRSVARPGDVDAAVDALLTDYEETGDGVWRLLALEERFPALGHLLATGRAKHRGWAEATFAPALDGLDGPEREQRVTLLVAATDVYTWKLMRRDMRMSRDAVAAAMREALDSLTRSPTPTQGRSR